MPHMALQAELLLMQTILAYRYVYCIEHGFGPLRRPTANDASDVEHTDYAGTLIRVQYSQAYPNWFHYEASSLEAL